MFGSCFRTLAVILVSDLFLLCTGKFALQVLKENDARVSHLMEKNLQVKFGNQQPLLSQGDTWIQQVWHFLAFTEPWCKNLKAFSHLTLLPARREEGIVLLPLSDVYACRFARGIRPNPLSVELISCLTKLGVVVLPELPDYVARHTELLGRWVHYPSTEGLLDALKRINDDVGRRQRAVDNFNSSASAEEKDTLVAFLETSEDRHDPLEMFHQIKLFTEVTTKDTVSIDDVTTIAPDILPPLTPHRRLLSCSSLHRRVAIWLGAEEATLEKIVSEAIQLMKPGYSRFSSTEIITFMKFVLSNEELTASVDLMDLIRGVKFVPTTSGQLKLAEDLYDPTSSVLRKLFSAEDKFPSSPFLEPAILKTLKVLGLRGEDGLKLSDVTATSVLIQELFDQQKQSAEVKAEGLWEMLIQHSQQFDSDTLRRISAVRCLPCVLDKDRPDHYPKSLPYSRSSRLAKPQQMCLASQASLAGSILPVIGESMPSRVAKELQVGSRVDVRRVLEHLDNILIHYQSMEAAKYRLILNNVFQFLQRHMTESAVVQTLKEKQCVPSDSNDHLARPGAFWTKKSEDDIQLKPYRYLLPNDMQNEKKLFEACGAVLNQDGNLLQGVLLEIQIHHSQQVCSKSEFNRDFQLVKHILDVLKKNYSATDGSVLLPICHKDPNVLRFQRAKDCTVVSIGGWFSADSYDDDTEIFMVHPEIHHDTAVALGALKMKDRALTGIEDLDFGYEQREELTSRLQNLLKDSYTDGFSVPKELIQNADDAGATEVCFLLDERENEDARQNLITDGMASFQGPAFWAYNDATFSDSDFENITKLGAGTKKADASKVGRFGLGFNSVYNLTDVPSFISRHTMAMFDPHVKHLKGGAGLKLDFRRPVNRALLSRMPQQFKPFQGVFGCRLRKGSEVHYNGTLFRLPLRTAQQAEDSLIKNESYSKRKRREFLKMLLDKAGSLLMFTQSVKAVKVFYLPPDCADPSSPQCLLNLTKTSRSRVLQPLSELGHQTILQYFSTHWSNNADIKIVEDVKIEMTVTPEARSVCETEAHSSSSKWRLAWASGVDQSADMARQSTQEGLIPMAAVAALLGENHLKALKDSPSGFYKSGHLFCFLPLPETMGLEKLLVHINATFALTSSRRSLLDLTEDDLNSEGAAWNSALIADAVSRAYLLLLENVKNEAAIDPDFKRFFELWPVSGGPRLREDFFRCLLRDKNKLLPVPGKNRWVTHRDAWYLESNFRISECGDIAWKALQHFWDRDGYLVDVPSGVLAMIQQHAQASVVSLLDFFKETLFLNIDSTYFKPEVRDKLVLYGLRQRYDRLNKIMRKYRCIPCACIEPLGRQQDPIQNTSSEAECMEHHEDTDKLVHLKRAEELYHPGSTVLRKLFLGENMFPCGVFAKPDVLDILKGFGLKEECAVTSADIKRTSELIHNLWRQQQKKTAQQKAEGLWELLISHGNNLDSDALRNASTIRCLPCQRDIEKPEHYPRSLPYSCSSGLAKPRDLCHPSQACLVGSVLPVMKKGLSQQVADELRVGCKVDVKRVFEHLDNIIKYYDTQDASHYRLCLAKVFQFLGRQASIPEVVQTLKDKGCVLTESGVTFAKPGAFWINSTGDDIDLKPYRYPLPHGMLEERDLFQACGANLQQDSQLLRDVLSEIQNSHSQKIRSQSEFERDMQLVKLILDVLKKRDSNTDGNVILPIRHSVPNVLHFQPAKHCTVMSGEGLFSDGPFDTDDELYVVHPDISQDTAVTLGALKMKDRALTGIEDLDFGYEQREELTSRLQNLLKDSYTDGFSVPKELIQNADDAGATEVCFLLDERENEDARQNLITDGMASFQGPAFWAYNDATFSDSDFENIIKLGAGTKKADASKVGRFGLGFNSVYNLTDVPSFISRHTMAMFDPHVKHLKRGAGLKLDFRRPVNRALLSRMPQQFKPFQGVFGCKLHNDGEVHYNGTLFRFPLRTLQQAADSRIKNESYSESKRREFLKMLLERAGGLLMFTQSVRKVKVFYLPRDCTDPSSPQCLLDLTKTLHSRVLQSERGLLDQTILKYFTSKWSDNNDIRIVEDVTIAMEVKPEAQSVCDSEAHTSSTEWRLAWASGVDQSAALARLKPREGLVPIAAVATLMEDGGLRALKDSPRGFYKSGHLYCFLPLSDSSDCGSLPVHVNATFALTSSRRSLLARTEDDLNSEGAAWNSALIADAVSRAYLLLLENVQNEAAMETDFKRFFELWPVSGGPYLVESFWKRLVANGNKILPVPGDSVFWVAFTQAWFLSGEFRDSDCGNIAWKALQHFWNKEGHLVDVPTDIYAAIAASKQADVFQAKVISAEEFYRDSFFPNIDSSFWEKQHRDKLVHHALLQRKSELDTVLADCPCIPCADSQRLKQPAEMIHPKEAAAKLYLPSDGHFPQGEETAGDQSNVNFCSAEILQRLVELGMITDDLPWEMVLERAASVADLVCRGGDTAHLRTRHIVEYLSTYSNRSVRIKSCPPDVKVKLSETQFLPVRKKPADWSFPWASGEAQESVQLAAPCDLYSDSVMDLVGCHKLVVDNESIGVSSATPVKVDVLETLGVQGKENPSNVTLLEISKLQLQTIAQAKKEDPNISDALTQRLCLRLYEYMTKCLDRTSSGARNNIFRELCDKEVFWTGTCFVDPSRVAIQLRFDCRPYRFQVETSFQKFKLFFKAIGVKDTLSAANLASLLEEISREFAGKELGGKMIDLVSGVGQLLCESLHESSIEDELKGCTVFLPDRHGFMKPVYQLCVDDCEWLKETDTMTFVNDKVPRETAVVLGVKSKRRTDFESFSEAIPFGQSEALTDRIRRLLEGYTFDSSLFKELLQNADDAGASEIRFITDPRSLETERVFEGCEDLQGPALCVFNDKSFTKGDMEGIQNLGRGSKWQDSLKTGQYGVGFNAVYHITDVPSFWTLEDDAAGVICILDPNCKYVPTTTPNKPGMKLKNIDRIRESYPDMFAGYLGSTIDMSKSGTLFRFPLRTEKMARTSEIKKKAVTISHIDGLLKEFQKEMSTCLLFLNNLRKIGIYTVRDDGSVELESEVNIDIDQRSIDSIKTFKQKVCQASKSIQDETVSLTHIAKFEACSLMTVHNSNGLKEEWLVVQRVGFQDSSRVSSELHSEWHKETFRLLPRGGVAVKLTETSEGMGLHIPRPSRHQAFCILPLPVFTNLPMHVNGHFALDHETRRGLWDNRVDDKPDVKTEWNEAIAAAVIVPAYITALRQIRDVCFSSAETLDNRDLRARLEYYHSLFPDLDLETAPTQFWTNMRKKLYKEIANQEVPLFPVLSPGQTGSLEWVPAVSSAGFAGHFNNLQKVFCDAPDKPQTSNRRAQQSNETGDNTEWARQKAKRLKTVLKRLNMKVLEAPYSIFENFMKSGENRVVDISPETVVRFLKSAGSETPGRCNINDLPQSVASTPLKKSSNVHTLLKFVGYKPFLLENLQGLPLCLRQSGNLYFFHQTEGNDKPIVSSFFSLLTGSEDLFIHQEIMAHLLPVSDTVRAWVRELDIPTLCRLLPQTLSPEIFRTGNPCRLDINPLPSELWLKTLWTFVDSRMDTRGISDPEEVRRAAEAKLQDLMGWSLLPVKQSTGNVVTLLLYPVRDRHRVVFLNEKPDQSNHTLWMTLKTLRFPYLNKNFLPAPSVTTTIVASIGHPVALLKALFACASSLKPQVDQAKTILSYLNGNLSGIIQSFGDKAELQKMLRRLPLYPEIDGKLTEVFSNMDVLCLSDIPSTGLVQWATNRQQKLVLLKKYGLPESLCTFLDFRNPRSPQFYHEYLLPTMEDLPRSAILDHMSAIKRGLEDTSKWPQYDKDRVVERLRVTEFIEVDEELCTADAFYSPHHPVFRVMCLPCDTPPSPFCCSQWEWFMKKAGMISEVTQDMFIRFAHALEDEGKSTQIRSTAMKSDTLVRHLFHRSDLTGTFLSQLKDIRFVFPSEWAKTEEGEILCKIAKPFCTDRLVSFAESCREKNLHLTWSSGCILRPNADPNSYQRISEDTRRFIMNHLCIQDSVAKNKVIEHVQNVCETLSGHSGKELFKSADSSDLVKKVMMKVYRYLQKNVEDEDIVVLKRLAIICDIENQQMLKPVNVVVDLRKEEAVRGHIVKAPALFGEFFSLFKRLGAAERVTADHYATVLSRLEEKAGENVLHVEEMKLYVQTSVRELFKCLRSNSVETKRLTVDHVYLPSDTECLTRSTQLVFIDDIPLRKRFQEMPQDLHVFIGFKKLEIDDMIPQNELKLLPEKHQVQFLSHILTEAVSEDVKRRAAEGQYSRAIDRKMKSPELGDAVVRLAFDHHSKHGKAGTSFTKATADQILQSLSSIVIREIEGLKTVLVWTRNGVLLDGTERDQKSFVDKSLCGDRSCTVYLDRRTCNNEGIKSLSITKCLTNAVIHSIGVDVNRDYLLVALQNAREALVQMDEDGIQPVDFSTEVDKTVFPPSGTFIPLLLHCYLDNSFESFYNGEHAGFELYDPQVDKLETEENVPVYIYAIVIEEVEQEGEVPLLAKRYRIDLGPERGETEASVTQLYKFVRKPNQGTPKAVEIYEGRTAPEGATSAAAETSAPLDFKAVMKEIRRILTEAWQNLDERDRNRVVKRLLLKWHPDKNIGNETFCTRVVQLLQHYIKELEKGNKLPDDENEDRHSSSDSSSHPHWDSFFEHMNRRSRAHRDSFNSHSGGSRSGSSYRRRFREEDYRHFHYNSYTNASSTNPQPGEARRWFRQAQADLDAARTARASSDRGHNWVCFQCHQVTIDCIVLLFSFVVKLNGFSCSTLKTVQERIFPGGRDGVGVGGRRGMYVARAIADHPVDG